MPLSPEQLGFTRQTDIDANGGAVRIITRKGAPTGPTTDNRDAGVRFGEGMEMVLYLAHRTGRALNELVTNEGLTPPFESGEILFGPYTDNPVLRPDKVPALSFETSPEGKTTVRPLHLNPLELQNLITEGKEIRHIRTTFDMGDTGKLLTLPVDFGPRDPEGRAAQGLMSIFMEKKDKPTDPLIVIGDKEELTESLSKSGKNKGFEPVRLSKQVRQKINEQLEQADVLYGNKRPLIPEALETEGDGNVIDGEVDYQNGRFVTAVGLNLADGRRISYHLNQVLNFSYEKEGETISEETEASVFVTLTVDSQGKPLIATVLQRRIQGNTGNLEIPRGFANNHWRELREELGLGPNFVVDYRKSSVKLAEDPIRANVQPDFNILILPNDKKYHLEAQHTRDASEIEVISPDWMRLDEFIYGAVTGEFVNDAHSVAGLMLILTESSALELTDEAKGKGIVLQRIQDWRSGDYRLTIPRGNGRNIDTLRGDINPNSGLYRIWNELGYSKDPSILNDGSYEVVGLNDVLEMIKSGKMDIVSMTTMFKLLFQKGLAQINKEAVKELLNR